MYRTALALLLVLAARNQSPADEELCGYAFGKFYHVAVHRKELEKTPDWDSSREEKPPLSGRKALTLATEFQQTLIRDSAKWKWELQYFGLRYMDGRWYWLAYFEAHPQQPSGIGRPHSLDGLSYASGHPPNLYLAVLMDGTVVKPHIEMLPSKILRRTTELYDPGEGFYSLGMLDSRLLDWNLSR